MNRDTCFAYSFSMFIGNGFIINLWIQERGIKWNKVGNEWYFYDEFKMSKDLNATCTPIFNKSEDELDLRVRRYSTFFCKDMRQIQRYSSIWEQYHQLTICSTNQTQHNRK